MISAMRINAVSPGNIHYVCLWSPLSPDGMVGRQYNCAFRLGRDEHSGMPAQVVEEGRRQCLYLRLG